MKTPFRELQLYLRLVELVKAPQRLQKDSAKAPRRLREATVVAPEHPQNGCAATAPWSVHEAFVEPPWLRRLRGGFMEPSWGLRGCSGATMVASCSLRGAFAELWCHLGATGNSSNNDSLAGLLAFIVSYTVQNSVY